MNKMMGSLRFGTLYCSVTRCNQLRCLCRANLRCFQIERILLARKYYTAKGVFGYYPHKVTEFVLSEDVINRRSQESNTFRYISAYREFGHFKANINPLKPNVRSVPELDRKLYGLSSGETYNVDGLLEGVNGRLSINELEEILRKIYCHKIGAEFSYLPTLEEREWFASAFELISDHQMSVSQKQQLATDMIRSQVWDNFVATKYQSVKRYGGEGAETMISFFTETFARLADSGVEQVVMGMPHRGRLNLLTGMLKFPPVIMFQKMKGLPEFPDGVKQTGDVLSHLVSSIDLPYSDKLLHVTMIPNPSHLEAVNPVVCGKTRARQRTLGEGNYSGEGDVRGGEKVVAIQVHGDAALSGQGVMQETLVLAGVPHFDVGGAIHVCVNNQVGYTTPGERTRSTEYCTDVAKMASFPILHVNGDDPEAVSQAARLAVDYQRRFRRDVFVDLICWRRWGHNELDNPRFTNPGMYRVIDARKSVPDCYAETLVSEGVLSQEEVNQISAEYHGFLNSQMALVDEYSPKATHLEKQWSQLIQAPHEVQSWDTGVPLDTMKFLGAKSVEYPEEFSINQHLKKTHVEARLKKLMDGNSLDWATAEALAMATLLHQGYSIRLCGQDVGRGTFSQRHCMLIDQETDEIHIPLNHLGEGGGLEVVNSILSEEAVLGFEYGFSIESPDTLPIWEAQFGDFFNGAQIIIDTFVSAGETKWLLQSGLVMLLPHGYDGAGPEHSSCHLERFLQNCDSREDSPDGDDVNWCVVFPTTPAQFFHLLRRQMVRNYRKPLIVAGPKALLRLPAATSSLQEMSPGTRFQPIIGDTAVNPDNVRKIIFVSGKHYYALKSELTSRNITDMAIVRLEQLCPFPVVEINKELSKYKKAKTFIWSQEEHRNMGSWSFVNPRFANLCGTKLKYAGRETLGTPAVGIGRRHVQEVQMVMDMTFKN